MMDKRTMNAIWLLDAMELATYRYASHPTPENSAKLEAARKNIKAALIAAFPTQTPPLERTNENGDAE